VPIAKLDRLLPGFHPALGSGVTLKASTTFVSSFRERAPSAMASARAFVLPVVLLYTIKNLGIIHSMPSDDKKMTI
jgi:hypothetical protein